MKYTINDTIIFDITAIHDNNGSLISIEGSKDFIPNFKRVFYAYNVPSGEVRGYHAHKECHQVMVAAQGRVEVIVKDGNEVKIFELTSPNEALLLPAGLWAEERYHDKAILMVICSEYYDADDYICDFEEYQTWNEC